MRSFTYGLSAALLLAMGAAAPAQDREDITARNAEVVARYYPHGAMRRGEEGAVEFRVVLDRDAKIASCAITRSSGFRELDERTCDLMVETAHFTPIRDGAGWRAGSAHDGRLVWRIPDNVALPDAMPVAKPRRIYAGDRIVCRRQPRRDSMYVTQKICLSADDWRRQISYAQGAVHEMQAPGGAPVL